jgi:pimeloyl-ACP methyl ester carboxylesterase
MHITTTHNLWTPTGSAAETVLPVKLRVSDEALDHLRARLTTTNWPPTFEPPEVWERGVDAGAMSDLVDYWANDYDWRGQEDRLNSYEHYLARIAGVDMHFVLKRGGADNRLPILLAHSWPFSFLEMLNLADVLADPIRGRFDVVVLSLPGFPGSGYVPRLGYGYQRMASDVARLMTQTLRYSTFGVHGGDVGALLGGYLASDHADVVAGLHTLDPILPFPDLSNVDNPLTPDEQQFLEEFRQWRETEGAYGHIQRTKPHTLSFGLSDSPVGLAAWLAEKFYAWTDAGAQVFQPPYRDDLLTNIMLYWFSNSIGPAIRLYRETREYDPLIPPGVQLRVPSGIALTPAGSSSQVPRRDVPRSLVERVHSVKCWTVLPRGGHFASWEAPDEVAESIHTLFD